MQVGGRFDCTGAVEMQFGGRFDYTGAVEIQVRGPFDCTGAVEMQVGGRFDCTGAVEMQVGRRFAAKAVSSGGRFDEVQVGGRFGGSRNVVSAAPAQSKRRLEAKLGGQFKTIRSVRMDVAI